jgi:hypothetical protein
MHPVTGVIRLGIRLVRRRRRRTAQEDRMPTEGTRHDDRPGPAERARTPASGPDLHGPDHRGAGAVAEDRHRPGDRRRGDLQGRVRRTRGHAPAQPIPQRADRARQPGPGKRLRRRFLRPSCARCAAPTRSRTCRDRADEWGAAASFPLCGEHQPVQKSVPAAQWLPVSALIPSCVKPRPRSRTPPGCRRGVGTPAPRHPGTRRASRSPSGGRARQARRRAVAPSLRRVLATREIRTTTTKKSMGEECRG